MSVLKNYDLDRIEPIMKDCSQFFRDLILSYKVQGIKVPSRLKELKESVEKQIHKIERNENE